jgi:DNA polymerase III subunit delta'
VRAEPLDLPWLEQPLSEALRTRRAHALLVHGAAGVGQFELALALARAWLCDTPDAPAAMSAPSARSRPCGTCASCRLVQARSHPDLLVVLPEALREALGWASEQGDDAGDKASKAKPSKDIKVDAVRAVVSFAQTSSARGRGKVVLLYPAERMNAVAANTLLKTLEEPPGEARFVLASAAPDALLPTIRSRCQALALPAPPVDQALAWLKGRGAAQAELLLRATGGQPLEALDWAAQGVDATLWASLPRRVASGDVAALANWPLPRLVNALQKLCHDLQCVAVGATPRYFMELPRVAAASLPVVSDWARALALAARQAEHPWHQALMTEALLQQGQAVLGATGGTNAAVPARPARPVDSLHSRA